MRRLGARRSLVIVSVLLTLLSVVYGVPGAAAASTATLHVSTGSLPAAGQGAPYQSQLAATGGTGSLRWTVTSGELPTGLTLAADGLISGTPSDSGVSSFQVQVSDSTNPTPQTASASLSITVEKAAVLAITSGVSLSGSEGQPMSAAMTATGGTGPYTWSTAGAPLPIGLTMSSGGVISGTPTQPGTFQVTVVVTDSSTPTPRTAEATVTVAVSATPTLAVTPPSLPSYTQGQSASTPLAATGGLSPYTWSLASGSLPAGLTLDAASGLLAGTPLEAGTFHATVEVTDSSAPVPQSAIQAVTITVKPSTPQITSTVLPGADAGASYSADPAVSGGVAPYTWSLTTGSLPPGLTLDPSGYISGSPTKAGTYQFGLEVADSAIPSSQLATATATIVVQPPAPLAVSSTSLPDVTENEPAQISLQASGGTSPYTWSVKSGTLPPAMTLQASTGTISGTPSQSGTYDFTVGVTDSAAPPDSAQLALALTVSSRPTVVVTVPTLPPAAQGVYYTSSSAPFTATGGSSPYTWSVVAGSLPAGLQLEPGGYLDGIARSAGTYHFTVQATDSATPSADTGSASATLVVGAAPTLSVSTASIPELTEGQSAFEQLSASGGTAPYYWGVTFGSLPPGVTLDQSGYISGTPQSSGTATFTVSVSDSSTPAAETATATLTVTVNPAAPLAVTLPTAAGLPPFTQGQPSTQSLSATGGVAPYTWSVTSGSLPAGLTLQPDGTISGTPVTAATYHATVQVTDSASPPDVTQAPLQFLVNPSNPLAVSTPGLPDATQGIAYSTDLRSTGGTAPYTWAVVSGHLPSGIALSATTGALTGSAQTPGDYTFTVGVTDSSAPVPQTATATMQLAVDPPPPLAITSASFPAVVQGQDYPAQINMYGEWVSTYTALTATGGDGNYVWTLADGSLPPGMSLDRAGLIAGTPTSAGVSTFTVEVSDTGAWGTLTAQVSGSIFSNPAPTLTAQPFPAASATVDQAFYAALDATGGVAPYTWSATSGTVPPGLTLGSDGSLTGTPTAAGIYSFTATVTDSATPAPGTATYQVSVAVAAGAPLSVNTAGIGPATQGQWFFQPLSATGGAAPYSWALTAGALPVGLALSSDGTITGTPTGSGSSSFTVQVSDNSSPPENATASLSLTVEPAAILATITPYLPQATVGQQFKTSLGATGGVAPYTWSVAGGSLPAGLTLDPSGSISGVPTTAGTYNATVVVTDSATPTPTAATARETVAITVAAPGTLALGYSYVPSPQTAGDYVSGNFSASGGVGPYTWTVTSGVLPPGVSLSADYGNLDGKLSAAGSYRFTVEVTDSAQPTPAVATETVSMVVDLPGPLAITTTDLPGAQQGAPYAPPQMEASGGTGSYTWSLAGGTLPAGLTLSPTGAISGTPTGSGVSSFTVEAADGSGSVESTFSIAVSPSPALDVATTGLPGAIQGQPYHQTLAATGGVGAYTWTLARGSLPAGLTLDASSGVITGVATSTGIYSFAAAVTDSSTPHPQTSQSSLTIDVAPAAALAVTNAAAPAAIQGVPYSASLSASGGVAPYTWSVVTGQLPAGLSLDAAHGRISGIPTASGSEPLTVAVTDSSSPDPVTVTSAVTIDVAPAGSLSIASGLVPAPVQGRWYDLMI